MASSSLTNGAAQAFTLLCKFISEDGYALVENPLSYGILHTLESNNVKVRTIEVDERGINTSKLPSESPDLIFTTPSHQFPTGVIFPISRRIEMIKYARKNNIYIVEDDYDSEFRFEENPIESMQVLDPDHVIYVGTFSKIFMPSLRMGYVILPDNLINKMKEIKYVADLHSPILEQLTMAEFIKQGLLDRHIKKMRNIYYKRRNHLIKCLKTYFKGEVVVSGVQAGMHLVATFNKINFDSDKMKKIYDSGIEITPLKKYYVQGEKEHEINDFINKSLVFGYGNTNAEDIENGIMKLHTILEQSVKDNENRRK